MTKEKYMALADIQALWNDSIKPWINDNKAAKSDLPTFATTAECRAIVTGYTPPASGE